MTNSNSSPPDFPTWMRSRCENVTPYKWQCSLGEEPLIQNRLIHIPTGFGKTLGVLCAWTYNSVERGDPSWPRRLVWCLPMRTLVEQTAEEIRKVLPKGVQVHVVMGGEDPGEWHLNPAAHAVLVGTQDMLLSRALNRGYASPRARWPMEFGLLNSDCLWIMDEVQLMDVGLATSAQLQHFREEDRPLTPRPSYTWWMSATLQPEWLKSVDTQAMVAAIEPHTIRVPDSDKHQPLWTGVHKGVHLTPAKEDKEWAAFVREKRVTGQTTLVIVNTVKRAVAVFDALSKDKSLTADLRLIHSRFRPHERGQWRDAFLKRDAGSGADRIIVATQVIEAGVDISTDCLFTDLAPWASLVQRFGRAARYGGEAAIYVCDIEDEKRALPYTYAELEAARTAIRRLTGEHGGTADVSPKAIEAFERDPANLSLIPLLYPYSPDFLLLRKELDDLFDTTPDLTGGDIDISRFIRSGEDRDCQVFWRDFDRGSTPGADCQPRREELCPASIGDLTKWVKDSPKDGGTLFWSWDYLDGAWRRASDRDIRPGMVLLARADAGGYSPLRGFDPKSSSAPPIPEPKPATPLQLAEAAQDDESLACGEDWQTIAEHGHAVAVQMRNLCDDVLPPDDPRRYILDLAARWHDLGKAHPAFASLLLPDSLHPPGDIAKAPASAWRPGRACYTVTTAAGADYRPGFRHELVSALALLDALHQYNPAHEALLGPWSELISQLGGVPVAPPSASPTSNIQRILDSLDSAQFDLLLYLIAAHHGKVRMGFHATPADQDHPVSREGDSMPIRGVMDGDTLPPVKLTLPDGSTDLLPATTLSLEPASIGISPQTGASWTERCTTLRTRHGSFALAWLEALLRAADILASKGVRP